MGTDAYTTTFRFTARLAGTPLTVVSKPGLEQAERVPDAAVLAAELIRPAPDERVLLLGCGHGALAVALARQLPHGRLTLSDPSLIALRMTALTLAANGVTQAQVSEQVSQLPAAAALYDRVVLMVPQSRALGRRWLVEAHGLLRPGGVLNVAGANALGVQPLIGDAAQLFGAAHTLGYGRGCRVAEARRTDLPGAALPAWASAPGIAPGSWYHLVADLPGGPLELLSLPGVFSYDRLDAGTAFLLQHLALQPGLRVLDAGCGYGPIGIAAARRGAAQVLMLDVNLLAVAAARANLARLGLQAATAAPSDALEAATGQRFDLVLSNPPFHSGKAVDTTVADACIARARDLLVPEGRIVLVASSFLPFERHMAVHFARVRVIAANRSFRVIEGRYL